MWGKVELFYNGIFFIISTTVSVLILFNKNSKLISRLSAFISNTIILGVVTWVLYTTDEEAKMFGFVHLELVIAIQLITWINWLLLEVIKYRRTKA